GRLAPDAVDELLAGSGRALHGRAAPPRGLTLERVIYASANKSNTNQPGASPEAGTRSKRNQDRTGEQGT
ncbi:MAG: hypothetical protein QOI85_1251, partial [Chloroflexota bacterium]|nr:hypothetical protein [Chloroflexota bacterium]